MFPSRLAFSIQLDHLSVRFNPILRNILIGLALSVGVARGWDRTLGLHRILGSPIIRSAINTGLTCQAIYSGIQMDALIIRFGQAAISP
jgi:hypothetical protein